MNPVKLTKHTARLRLSRYLTCTTTRKTSALPPAHTVAVCGLYSTVALVLAYLYTAVSGVV